MYFRDELHQKEFYELLSQAEINPKNEGESQLLKRQIAFFYLIALYQAVFEEYEGMKFYVEVYEEISLDGPVYLLDDQIGNPKYEHEVMLKIAKSILMGDNVVLNEVPQIMRDFVEEAISFIESEQTMKCIS